MPYDTESFCARKNHKSPIKSKIKLDLHIYSRIRMHCDSIYLYCGIPGCLVYTFLLRKQVGILRIWMDLEVAADLFDQQVINYRKWK